MEDVQRSLTGFGSYFETEALPNALPKGRNAPQEVAYGLYAEQINGSAFTAPRAQNKRSWLYRLYPSVVGGRFERLHLPQWDKNHEPAVADPTPMRWGPIEYPKGDVDFCESMVHWISNGGVNGRSGGTVYLYAATQSMNDRFLCVADGELLVIPQEGGLQVHTELGCLEVQPMEIVVIPAGMKFKVDLLDEKARGYVCENHGAPFILPDLGPIGANGLANPRDFIYPNAAFEDKSGCFELVTKYQNTLWRQELSHYPLDVVAWHGNLAPYKYDLRCFNTMNTVSFDHPDPSIFTVLTSQTTSPGVANIDFVIFPERWMVAENTFRPPYYHRNIMSEYMGLIQGVYDAKPSGFMPGGGSLHNAFTPHGPDAETFEKASHQALEPEKQENTLAFMLETSLPWQVSPNAINHPCREEQYSSCWQALKKNYK